MEEVILKGKSFKKILDESVICKRIGEISKEINKDYKDKEDVVFLVILNGAFIFSADLLRGIEFNPIVSFVKLTSYSGMDNNRVKCLLGVNETLTGRNVIIVDDIIDSGNTIKYMYDIIKFYKPLSIRVAGLLIKSEKYNGIIPINYKGFEISNEFVVGYGLDYDGYGRNLRSIYQLKK